MWAVLQPGERLAGLGAFEGEGTFILDLCSGALAARQGRRGLVADEHVRIVILEGLIAVRVKMFDALGGVCVHHSKGHAYAASRARRASRADAT